MGANSSIEWCHHSFNPWWGCIEVSPGCQNCYAKTLAKRFGHDVWGPAKTTPRRMMSNAYWQQPIKWNKAAEQSGARARVFCASMADVFESHPQLAEPRGRLFSLIEQTPNLDWLLLTKRPENILSMVPFGWLNQSPDNVWFGTSVESQEQAEKRIPELLKAPARLRFLSCEPLLGPVNLISIVRQVNGIETTTDALRGTVSLDGQAHLPIPSIHWVIVGGESGPGARPMHPDWARSLRDQCQAAGDVAFFFKQWGEYRPTTGADWENDSVQPKDIGIWNLGVGWRASMVRAGKHAAGRLLDEREWNEVPA